MKNSILYGALIAFSAPYLASAQCVAPVTAANLLIGKTWAFRLNNAKVSAIGTFTGFANGYLAITETVIDVSGGNSNVINRQAFVSGRWMANANCNGGMLQFMLNRDYFSLNFAVVNAGTQLNLAGRDESFPGAPALPLPSAAGPVFPPKANKNDPAELFGIARLNPPKSCPLTVASGSLNVIANMKYNYALSGSGFDETGMFTPIVFNPLAYSGYLMIDNRLIVPTPVKYAPPSTISPVLLTSTSGRYIVYGDCSGGELLFMANGYARQLEFVFSKADFSEMFLIEDGEQRINTGIATKAP